MRITLQQTASNDDTGPMNCYLCGTLFQVGAVTCWAISEDNTLLGDVCPKCLARGPERMQELLERNAHFSRLQAEEDERIAAEGITDAPTLDEILAAEAFYERPRFKTGEEYHQALGRGEID